MSSVAAALDPGGRKRTPYVAQSEASECALACLAMIACHHGYQIDLNALRHQFALSLKGATLRQVMVIADSLGFNSRPLKGSLDSLYHMRLPAILHWDLNHFVVLTRIERGIRGTFFHIHDPATAPVRLILADLSQHWTGVALELERSHSFKPKARKVDLGITQLWSSINGLWPVVRSLLTLSIILQIAAIAAPFYLQIAIDTVLPAGDQDLLIMLAFGFGGLALINMVTTWARSLILVGVTNSLSYQVNVNLFHHLLRLPLSWFEKRHVGDVISRFSAIIPITQLISEGMIASFIDGLMAVVTLALMFVYSPPLAGLSVFIVGLYGTLRLSFLHTLKYRNVDAIGTAARENSLFIESVRGVTAIKAFGQEGNRQRLWQRAKVEAVNAQIKVQRLTAGFDACGNFLVAVERVVFVFLAVSLALEGKMSIGVIFAFQAYKSQFIDASMRLVEQAMNANVAKVHLRRLSDVALAKAEDEGSFTFQERSPSTGTIELRGVRFSYGFAEPEILRGVDLRVEPGEMVALVGPSGGGKTTLLKVMIGLFEPTAGQVLIGEQLLNARSRKAFRSRIGVVAQDDVLYAGSIAENISFFDPDLDMDRVIEVARFAFVHEDICAMPLRYETLVGDMGSVLSGGQKQRVLLARALYNRPAMLFMDEGTANLDPVSEQKITAAISSLGITRVMVAHRPAMIHASNRVLLCADGGVHALRKDTPEAPHVAAQQ